MTFLCTLGCNYVSEMLSANTAGILVTRAKNNTIYGRRATSEAKLTEAANIACGVPHFAPQAAAVILIFDSSKVVCFVHSQQP